MGGKRRLGASAEPPIVHCAEERAVDHGMAGCTPENGINRAARTECRSTSFREPLHDVGRLERLKAVEAAASSAALDLLAVIAAVPVRRVEEFLFVAHRAGC